jgi:hypothetical protein
MAEALPETSEWRAIPLHMLHETGTRYPASMSDEHGNGDDVDIIDTPTSSGALMRRDRPQEKTVIERRHKYVAEWRFVQRLTESQIVDRLAKLDPPIVTTRTTVSRDVKRLRWTFRQYFSQRNFDPRAEVGIIVAGIEHIVAKSFRDARRSTDGKERALHRKVALDAFERLFAVYEATGLVDQRDFLMPPDDGKKAERIPSGIELQRRFESVNVTTDEITSDAERSWSYGDAAAFERAGREAKGGISRPPTNGDGNDPSH